MESIGAFPDGEWDSFSKMFSTEELEFAAQFLGPCSFPLDQNEGLNFLAPSNFCVAPEANMNIGEVNESLFYTLNSNLHYMSQESSYASNCSSSVFIPNSSQETYVLSDSNHVPVTNDFSMSMDICTMDEKKIGSFVPELSDDIVMKETDLAANEDMSSDKMGNLNNCQPAANPVKELQLKRKFDVPELHAGAGDKINYNPIENTMKKPRVPRNVQKNKKNVQSRKNQKPSPNGNDGEESNAGSDRQSSSSYSSEDDNASQETNGGATSESKTSTALNLSGKTRASRGSATDPQSLYARKRRERINERLRILQNLVPNGTKVDISTMLEEAVHYVKFLQVQIKLLSSDDLWMYAPLAYNGVDIGLNHKISMLL